MKQFTIAAGSIIHIQGLPFYLVHNTTFEGHPANVAMVTTPDPDYPDLALWLENAKRPRWKRILGIR